MSKQKKKRSKPYTPKVVKAMPQMRAQCKVCGTACKLWDGDEFIKWRNVYAPEYKMNFLFVQECNCWETTEDWMEMKEV